MISWRRWSVVEPLRSCSTACMAGSYPSKASCQLPWVKGILRVVVHTFEQTERSSCRIRIISARKATFTETQYYQERKL